MSELNGFSIKKSLCVHGLVRVIVELVGGFSPSEKYESIAFVAQIGVNKNNHI